jgi:hypothetical protein
VAKRLGLARLLRRWERAFRLALEKGEAFSFHSRSSAWGINATQFASIMDHANRESSLKAFAAMLLQKAALRLHSR